MRVLLTINSVDPAGGGTTEAVLRLAGALAAAGADAHLAAHEVGVTLQHPEPGVRATLLARGRDAWDRHIAAMSPDVIHDHGLWLRVNRDVAATARRAGVPRIVSTHGMLSPWALGHHAWRKRAAWLLFQRRDLATAAAVHATSDAEAADVVAAGVGAPVSVIPHGVHLRPPAPRTPRDGLRRALFLGRLHPVKGLPALIDAWALARPEGWELVIAGPDAGDQLADLASRRDAAGLADAVRFEGLLGAEAKSELLGGSDLLVLPSLSENFGVVVAEALAAGVPAIVSRRAPWAAIERAGAGWWVEPEAGALAGAIREATALSDDERSAAGARGRDLVGRDYAWPSVAARMLALYEAAAAAA